MPVAAAAGGTGQVATAILSRPRHEVASVTGRAGTEACLRGPGASRILARDDFAEPVKRLPESETRAGL